MNFLFDEFTFNWYTGWIFSLSYLILANGVFFIFPVYIRLKFGKMPFVKQFTYLDAFFYWLILIYPIFLPLYFDIYFYLGLFFFLLGLAIWLISIFYFALSMPNELVTKGIYQFSRNPVYLGFTFTAFGLSLVVHSFILFTFVLIRFFLTHKLILAEEKICEKEYQKTYINYKNSIRRYF